MFIVYEHLVSSTSRGSECEVLSIGDVDSSEFEKIVYGKDPQLVIKIMAELMDALFVTNNRLYRCVVERIKSV